MIDFDKILSNGKIRTLVAYNDEKSKRKYYKDDKKD